MSQANNDLEEEIAIYGYDGIVDVTDRIEVFPKGKVFACDCGQDHGVFMDTKRTRCPTCNRICVDTKADSREFTDNKEQTNLSRFL